MKTRIYKPLVQSHLEPLVLLIALTCLDWLGDGLSHGKTWDAASLLLRQKWKLRIVAKRLDFVNLIDETFKKMRQYATPNIAITVRLLDIIREISGSLHRQPDRMALPSHAIEIERGSRKIQLEDWERKHVEESFRTAVKALNCSK